MMLKTEEGERGEKMKTCILIGGIGSGKSTVSHMLLERGAKRVDLDECGHETLLDPEVISQLADTFGPEILDENGAIVRSELAARAFVTQAKTIQLNAITQPRLLKVAQAQLDRLEQEGCELAVIEISAYDGPEGTFAPLVRNSVGVIAVTSPTRVRVQRAVAKGFAEDDVRRRIARQVSDAQRALWADYVISNKGTIDQLEDQVELVWQDIAGK
ncbi:MAG: dephospho-CoA kinase [Denitrobacterium detoxificans]|jgi:dephospho-CoA kinase|nr:dephospho-CoA kinase [Denitrobacterium detoxificans]